MARLNDLISRENPSAMFVTLFIAVLDLSSGRLQYCNGGHNLPYVLSDGTVRPIENTPGALVGAFEGARYQGNAIQLDRGHRYSKPSPLSVTSTRPKADRWIRYQK